MLDHLGFSVADFPRSRAFYAAALAPLGMAAHSEGPGWAMFGGAGAPQLWIGGADIAGPDEAKGDDGTLGRHAG